MYVSCSAIVITDEEQQQQQHRGEEQAETITSEQGSVVTLSMSSIVADESCPICLGTVMELLADNSEHMFARGGRCEKHFACLECLNEHIMRSDTDSCPVCRKNLFEGGGLVNVRFA